MCEMKPPRVEVLLNDGRENPSCPHGMSDVLFVSGEHVSVTSVLYL